MFLNYIRQEDNWFDFFSVKPSDNYSRLRHLKVPLENQILTPILNKFRRNLMGNEKKNSLKFRMCISFSINNFI